MACQPLQNGVSKSLENYHWGGLENFDSGGFVSDIHSNMLLKDFV